MSKITVSLLNFHGVTSHVEIALAVEGDQPTYYVINRWEKPEAGFSSDLKSTYEWRTNWANTNYTFEIDADPAEVSNSWQEYYENTKDQSSIYTNNCAVAAQWFLKKFAKIPDPNNSTASCSINHIACGIFVPSLIPVGITLPGRIISNAKYYHEQRAAERNPTSTLSTMASYLTCGLFKKIFKNNDDYQAVELSDESSRVRII